MDVVFAVKYVAVLWKKVFIEKQSKFDPLRSFDSEFNTMGMQTGPLKIESFLV